MTISHERRDSGQRQEDLSAAGRRDARCADAVRRFAIHLSGTAGDYDALLERMTGVGLVLIGEASHGTHEFYRERAVLTKRLIAEKGFRAIAATPVHGLTLLVDPCLVPV